MRRRGVRPAPAASLLVQAVVVRVDVSCGNVSREHRPMIEDAVPSQELAEQQPAPVDPGGDQHTARFFTGGVPDLSDQFVPGRFGPQPDGPSVAEATAGGSAADPDVGVDEARVDEVVLASPCPDLAGMRCETRSHEVSEYVDWTWSSRSAAGPPWSPPSAAWPPRQRLPPDSCGMSTLLFTGGLSTTVAPSSGRDHGDDPDQGLLDGVPGCRRTARRSIARRSGGGRRRPPSPGGGPARPGPGIPVRAAATCWPRPAPAPGSRRG